MPGPRKWLLLLFCSLFLHAGPIADAAVTQETGGQAAPQAASSGPKRPTDWMMVRGRLQIEAPTAPMRLGEENAVTVRLSGPALMHLRSMQRAITAHDESPWIRDADAEMPLQYRPDGSLCVHVTPQRPGKLELRFNAMFADGGFEIESVEVTVVAPNPPTQLNVGTTGWLRDSVLHMDLSRQWRRQRLWVTATYPGLKEPLVLQTQDVQFKVTIDRNEEAPIRLDPATGWVDALRIGHALITATSGGVTQTTCVKVTENAESFERSDCSELLHGGDQTLPTQPGADAPGALMRSMLPYTADDGRRGRFVADERVEIDPPAGPLHMAEENEIDLQVHGSAAMVRVECTTDRGTCVAWTGNFSRAGLTVQQRGSGHATISVFPMAFGPTEYRFFILFADGGVALKKLDADVEAGAAKPRAIGRACAANPYAEAPKPVRLVLGGNPALSYEATQPLYVFACYDGARNAVAVPAKLVRFEVRNEGNDPVVQVDPATGQATAAHVGQALVQEEFAGQTENTCVVVVAGEHRLDPDLSNCRALRARYGAQLPPLVGRVTPPDVIVPDVDAQRTTQGRMGAVEGGTPRIGLFGAAGGSPQLDAITAGTLSPDAHDRFAANGRLEIPLAGAAAEFGVSTKLPIRLQGPEVLAMTLYQERTRRFTRHAPVAYEEAAFDEEPQPINIFREDDGSLTMHVTALEMGTARFRIDVLFADGGVAEKRFEVRVKLPAGKPAQLMNALEEDATEMPATPAATLHLLMQPPSNTRTLFPYVSFDEKRRPVPLSPRNVTFTLQQAGKEPVIALDAATGTLTALRLGHALVRMRFDGAETDTCVVVMADVTHGDPSNCEELRSEAR